MKFRTKRLTIDGEKFMLRELSGLAVEAAQTCENDTRQGMALIALSMLDGAGHAPLYAPDALDEGLAFVMGLPARVLQELTDAVTELNAADLDDARKK